MVVEKAKMFRKTEKKVAESWFLELIRSSAKEEDERVQKINVLHSFRRGKV